MSDIRAYAAMFSSLNVALVESSLFTLWYALKSRKSGLHYDCEFQEYDGFSRNLVALEAKYEKLEQTRVSIRQLIRDVEPVVILPEECPLLGIARN